MSVKHSDLYDWMDQFEDIVVVGSGEVDSRGLVSDKLSRFLLVVLKWIKLEIVSGKMPVTVPV